MSGGTDLRSHPWWGLGAAIGTKHGKLDQFAPPLRRLLAVRLRTADIDTDVLGTFTGEVERVEPPLATARTKARWAIEATGAPIGLGSEGSYGPHPDVPSLAVGVEVAVCIDLAHEIDRSSSASCGRTADADRGSTISGP